MLFRTQERKQKIYTFYCVEDHRELLSTREAKFSDEMNILDKIVTAELEN